jgi:hypothetical protein
MEHEDQHGDIDRRSFLNAAGKLAVGAPAVGAIFEMMRPTHAWAQQAAKVTHPASARVLDRLRTGFTFQISVDVAPWRRDSRLPKRRWQGVSPSSKWERRC